MKPFTRDVIILPVDQTQYEVRPANGTVDKIMAEGFFGCLIDTREDGAWIVRRCGPVEDLARAVFRVTTEVSQDF